MNLALAVGLLACVPWIAKAVAVLWRGGRKQGADEQLSISKLHEFQRKVEEIQRFYEKLDERTIQDVQDLYEALHAHNDIQNIRYHEFYREFSLFRAEANRYMRNGGTTH